jgi:4-amino-4-deoxy-L-arabinose transferase-like glycosyltransferase
VHSAVGFLALEAIIVLYALIVVTPFAIVAALLWFWRRRSVDRLLAA